MKPYKSYYNKIDCPGSYTYERTNEGNYLPHYDPQHTLIGENFLNYSQLDVAATVKLLKTLINLKENNFGRLTLQLKLWYETDCPVYGWEKKDGYSLYRDPINLYPGWDGLKIKNISDQKMMEIMLSIENWNDGIFQEKLLEKLKPYTIEEK